MIASLAVWSASIAAGFTGFGFNLVAVPLLALVFLPKDAVIIALLLGALVSGSLAVVAAQRREIDLRLVWLLTLGSVPGLILGTLLFRHLHSSGLRIFIGAITVVCALLLLIRRSRTQRPAGAGSSLGVGLVGGTLAATTGTGGPPVVAYLMSTGADGAKVRGTVLSHVALVSLLALLAHTARGQVSSHQLEESLKLVPAVVIGLPIGSHLFRRTSGSVYRHVATLTLLVIGVAGVLVAVH
jgi:uncharacterized membrane protein YfcA